MKQSDWGLSKWGWVAGEETSERDIGCEADSNGRVGISELDGVGDIGDGTRADWEETSVWKRWVKSKNFIRNSTCM